MDRRQQKTRRAILTAFSKLLEQKRYSAITVQDIIDEADIGRSTFYAHFETKDELLHVMCSEIFDHVFSEVLKAETGHDFSEENETLEDKLTHLLYHLQEQKRDMIRVLMDDGNEIFLQFFRRNLEELFAAFLPAEETNVPHDFRSNHYVSSFLEAVKWWARRKMEDTPEMIVGYYTELTK